ncbi:MAG TPA: hypothetical protein VMT03_24720 [Polyangia bacterium]|nr:hypothetical protein [Polyangia bacterium]
MRGMEGPSFITVDLEVWSKVDLSPLARALEPRCFVLYVGKAKRKFLASFEAHGSSPEETIWRLLALVRPLRGRPKTLWREADARVFNIGFESGNGVALLHETPPGSGVWRQRGKLKIGAFETSLSSDVIQAIAAARGTLATTIYPPRREVRAKRRESADARPRVRPPNKPLQRTGASVAALPPRARR